MCGEGWVSRKVWACLWGYEGVCGGLNELVFWVLFLGSEEGLSGV